MPDSSASAASPSSRAPGLLMSAEDMASALDSLAGRLLERHGACRNLALIGIQRRGVSIAEELRGRSNRPRDVAQAHDRRPVDLLCAPDQFEGYAFMSQAPANGPADVQLAAHGPLALTRMPIGKLFCHPSNSLAHQRLIAGAESFVGVQGLTYQLRFAKFFGGAARVDLKLPVNQRLGLRGDSRAHVGKPRRRRRLWRASASFCNDGVHFGHAHLILQPPREQIALGCKANSTKADPVGCAGHCHRQ